MKQKHLYLVIAAIMAMSFVHAQDQEQSRTDEEIKRILVGQSIARYSGSCPCPYNTDRAGRRCGARSAYSRPGGASPLCYTTDVTDAMVQAYREQTENDD